MKQLNESQGAAQSWYVYMVQYQKKNLYTGITTDVVRRFSEHSSGTAKAAKALRGKGPYSLVYCEVQPTRSEALVRESLIKKMTRQQKQGLLQQCAYDLSQFNNVLEGQGD